MKSIIHLIFFLIVSPCVAQPTGNQKLFLAILDNLKIIHFEQGFKKTDTHQYKLIKDNFELLDQSADPTGFKFYPPAGFIHKTLMTDDHHIQIVKNKTDTMNIEILNAFNIYFLSIPFQKGNFKFYVNDGLENKWAVNSLPYKHLATGSSVYNITPADWSVFQVDSRKAIYEYFISIQFGKQHLLAMPIIPEDDPNFRNPRRISYLRMETADYNFDGQKDYREQKLKDTTRWNYFIYRNPAQGFVLDTLMSNLDGCSFDFDKKEFLGYKTTRVNPELTQMVNYEYINGKITLVRRVDCVHAFPNSEKMDCSVYVLVNGELVFKELIKGAE